MSTPEIFIPERALLAYHSLTKFRWHGCIPSAPLSVISSQISRGVLVVAFRVQHCPHQRFSDGIMRQYNLFPSFLPSAIRSCKPHHLLALVQHTTSIVVSNALLEGCSSSGTIKATVSSSCLLIILPEVQGLHVKLTMCWILYGMKGRIFWNHVKHLIICNLPCDLVDFMWNGMWYHEPTIS
jgi:hypothetical protein